MTSFQKTYEQLADEAITILIKIKEYITGNSNFDWTSYNNAKHLNEDIDKYIFHLKKGDKTLLDEMYSHFLPTSTFQEHSMANDWTKEYLNLAEQFDTIYENIKNYKP